MNITELARILKITPQELRNSLPQLGFHIGQKAIKINRRDANRIIKNWSILKRKIEKIKEAQQIEEEEEIKIEKDLTLKIPKYISVKDFSVMSGVPIKNLLAELMKNGIFSSLNERIDYETVWLIGSELGITIEPADSEGEEEDQNQDEKLKNILEKENEKDLKVRPPVIVVMGHVDHGKTKLLDAVRKSNVVEGEAGGITQHIGAYQVARKNNLITFIDTPGHEAFTAMRSRGAKIADLAILVVAADDGVKPQTVEAFKIIEAAKIPYVVAINKIDKPSANIEKTKQELSQKLKIVPEDWGGKIICAPISALKGDGIGDLLDIVLLVMETEIENRKANPDAPAVGSIIESNVSKGAGPIATILIQNGSLKVGDQLIFNNISVGKVRALNDYRGEKIEIAGPSTPVQIIGLKNMPRVGDVLEVGSGMKAKNKKFKNITHTNKIYKKETEKETKKEGKKINLIIKSDVLGSAEAIEESLEKINTDKVRAVILHKGLGNITDGNLKRAEASNATIIGFNVKLPGILEESAREKNVSVKLYTIIYDLINDIKAEMQSLVEPDIKRIELGKFKVLAIFRTDKKEQIIGGKITKGLVENNTIAEIIREKEVLGEGKITQIKFGKQNVERAEVNSECGLLYQGKIKLEEGDSLKIYKEEKTIDKI